MLDLNHLTQPLIALERVSLVKGTLRAAAKNLMTQNFGVFFLMKSYQEHIKVTPPVEYLSIFLMNEGLFRSESIQHSAI